MMSNLFLTRVSTYSTYGKVSLETQDEWLSVLHLATRWSFDDLRTLSVEHLGSLPTTSAIDKLLMGRKYDVSRWVSEAYVELCQRDEPLTLAECDKLSLVDIVNINSARHKARLYTGMRPFADIQCIIEGFLEPSPPLVLDSTEEMLIPSQSANPLSSPLATLDTSGDDILNDFSAIKPPDMPRISRLIKLYTQKPSKITISALQELVQPYYDQAFIMEAISESITAHLQDGEAVKNITELAQTMLDSISLYCGDPVGRPDQQSPTGSRWLAQCMMKHCYTNVHDWQHSNIGTPLAQRTIAFLAWLNETGYLSRDVFEPCWLEMIRQIQEPLEQWITSYYTLFSQNGSDIQTQVHALYIDQFFDRVQSLCDENSTECCYSYCSTYGVRCNICRLRVSLPSEKLINSAYFLYT